jgi:LmbE family N-acetylglucosaminyl deacetylase
MTDRRLRILVIGAHPDDADIKAGGTAAKWCALGHVVRLVSLTNGQARRTRSSISRTASSTTASSRATK